ncbi:MAG: hypothetical protein IFJ96_01250 [Acidobacteria bacterium]|nr:hypothetical protein [Candidatus Sulfomarinibacter sp. MAG AM2]
MGQPRDRAGNTAGQIHPRQDVGVENEAEQLGDLEREPDDEEENQNIADDDREISDRDLEFEDLQHLGDGGIEDVKIL